MGEVGNRGGYCPYCGEDIEHFQTRFRHLIYLIAVFLIFLLFYFFSFICRLSPVC
ncbi:MAG: hypothetical protein RQ758_03995 [Methanomicrobiaceae archaeon]|nr:hypothetical protein [Methanomicrobiaceae archaeon]